MRWRSEVSRFAPDRLAEFDELIADALNNPAPVQKAEQCGRVRAANSSTLAAKSYRSVGFLVARTFD